MSSDKGALAAELEGSSVKRKNPGERVAACIDRVAQQVTIGRCSVKSALQTVALTALRAGRDIEIEEAERLKNARLKIVKGP